MKTRHKRVTLALGGLAAVGAITALVLNAFESNLVFFYSPTQVVAQEAPKQRTFRIGGLVEEGSVKRDGVQVNFVITDTAKAVPVRYQGILPDLFKEGKAGQAMVDLVKGAREAQTGAGRGADSKPPVAWVAQRRARRPFSDNKPHGHGGDRKDRGPRLCYCCGKPGHVAANCHGKCNPSFDDFWQARSPAKAKKEPPMNDKAAAANA